MTKIIQYTHRPNNTELGKGNTHETYLLIGKEYDLSDLFPDGKDVNLMAVDRESIYTVKAAIGREFRINQFGPLYRDYKVCEGDEIVITIIDDGKTRNYAIRVNVYNRITLSQKNMGCEIGNIERLSSFGDKTNGYELNAIKDGISGIVDIIFDGAKPKRTDSPDLTDFYTVTFNGNKLENGNYYFDLNDTSIGLLKKSQFNEIILNGENIKSATIDNSKECRTSQNQNSQLLQQNSSDYRPYITAIKSKPFLLLAGISGTGKSRIVRELARACWDADSEEYKAHKPSNFEMVQVKPNWHDSSELIGYVSRVSGEPVYVAGSFLKFVAKAWENPDVPYFLCLDEMNLAPVEQYFAEYLSVVESRKAEDGVVKTDPILDKVPQQWYFDLVGSLTEIGEVQDRFKKDGICIPQNLIVVGTVNMDETTFSFSRKVLDRAMTIEMNEVNLTCGLDKQHETIGKLDKSHLIGTAVEGCDVYNAYKADCDTAIAYLNAINQHLEKTPFKVAYRTRNEFLLYVVNNLPYNKDENGEDVHHGWLLARALDEITCMKVLSRIEGDETKVSKEFLSELTKEIKTQLESLGECTYTAIRAEENKENNVWYSKSLDKLNEMTKRLESGYTSFWS